MQNTYKYDAMLRKSKLKNTVFYVYSLDHKLLGISNIYR